MNMCHYKMRKVLILLILIVTSFFLLFYFIFWILILGKISKSIIRRRRTGNINFSLYYLFFFPSSVYLFNLLFSLVILFVACILLFCFSFSLLANKSVAYLQHRDGSLLMLKLNFLETLALFIQNWSINFIYIKAKNVND